jgi:hypothetical protein
MASPRKRLYVTGVILAALVLVALALQWGVRGYLKPRIAGLLQHIIVEGSDSLYRFTPSDVVVDLWSGSIALKDCRLTLDSSRYIARKGDGSLPPLTVSMAFSEIRASGLQVWTWLFHKRADCARLDLVGAQVSLYRHPVHKGAPGAARGKDLYSLVRPLVRSIRVGEILLGDVRVAYDNGDSARPFRWTFDRCDLRLRDILIDSTTVSDSMRVAYARTFTVDMKKVSMLVSKQRYRLTLGELTYDFEAREAQLDHFTLEPVLDAPAFYRRLGHQEDRYSLHIPRLRLGGLNIAELLLYNYVHVDSAHLESPQIHIYHDRTLLPSPFTKMGKYPQQLLQKAPIDILVRRMLVRDGQISYAEKTPRTKETGTLTFERVDGLLSNITNVPDAIARDPRWTVDLKALFLGYSPITALFTFYLGSPGGRFSVDARLSDLDAPALDPVTRPLAKASVRSFHLDTLVTHITGDQHGARGDVRMRYHDLRLELLRTTPDSGVLSKKPLLSFLVNRVLVYKDNPPGGKQERVAVGVTQNRDEHKSFFNLIWKTLFGGVRQIALKVKLGGKQH